MKRPSFQFYPADWRGNANLRRCSHAARGAWVDVMCLLHDSDEYGVIRWPLAELAQAAGVPLKLLQELAQKSVLKGGDAGIADFTFTPRHAGQDGESVTLIPACQTPCWFSSRMVVDEHIRLKRGAGTRFEPSPKVPPMPTIGDGKGGHIGDGPTSSSPSTSPSTKGKKEKVAAELPVEAAFWNSNCGVLPKIAAVSPGRMKHLLARRQDLFWTANYEQAVVRLTKSAFCTGTNDRQWKADFDFILQPDAVSKIMEGKYDNKAPLGTNGQPKVERNLDVWHIGDGKYNLTSGPKREHFPNDGSFESHLRMYESWQANRLRQKEAR